MPLREREREKEKIFFALLMAQNASFGKRGFWPVRKKEKGLVFGEEWE